MPAKKLEEIGQAGYEKVKRNYMWEQIVEKTIEVYKRIQTDNER